jgi:hypothetical protein
VNNTFCISSIVRLNPIPAIQGWGSTYPHSTACNTYICMYRPCPISHLCGGSSTPSREASQRSKRASAGFPKSVRPFGSWTRARPLEPSLVNCTDFLLEQQSDNSITISYSACCNESRHCGRDWRRYRVTTEHPSHPCTYSTPRCTFTRAVRNRTTSLRVLSYIYIHRA